MVFVLAGMKFVSSLAFLSDPSLVEVWALDIVPYGILWQLTNPYYWIAWYPQLMALLDLPVTALNYRLLSRRVFLLWTITDIHWFQGFFANASVTWLSPYPVIGPVWTLLQKLPVGYWPVLDNGHVHCALWCSGISAQLAKGQIWRWGNIVTYSIILAWTILPTVWWLHERRRHKERPEAATGEAGADTPGTPGTGLPP